jgi:pimeloyl-ACP methyl ester carboxylesterase
MATYVFVHGSFQGAWCWREIVPRLENKGHSCVAFDLPGHGNDPMPPEDVTFQDYVRAVIDIAEPLPQTPILVGHSMTAIISQVAEVIPSRLRALVYVAGLLLPDGKAMLEMVNDFDPQYLAQLVWAPDRKTARWSPAVAREYAYPLCPPSVVEEILPLLTAEPVAPYEARLQTTADNFGRVPRYYVECARDRIVPISLQRKMHSAIPCKRVYSIDADHSPFFSVPAELTSILLAIAEAELFPPRAGTEN